MNIVYNTLLYKEAFLKMPIGLFIMDQDKKICSWNLWMEENTGVATDNARGHTIAELFPQKDNARFEWALEQVLSIGSPQVLSQILNHYLIPIELKNPIDEKFSMMQQYVEILPIKNENKKFALVCIMDVTNGVRLKSTLMEMAHKLEEQSLHDALTGIYNRRFLWEWLDNHIAQAKRSAASIACCMYDLDHFKRINDEYGHATGDAVLVGFVALVKKVLRSEDIFVRYGGEEFLTLLPRVNATVATQQADRILELLKTTSLLTSQQLMMTCSVGIAVWDSEHPVSAKRLVKLADTALYAAKEAGRARVHVASW